MKKKKYLALAMILILAFTLLTGCSDDTCSSCKGSIRCFNCNGTGYCELCYGEGKYYELITDRYERCYCSGGRCTICFGNGVCKYCNGLGTN